MIFFNFVWWFKRHFALKVTARQTERRLEESKAEAAQLRKSLTLIEKNLNDGDSENKLHRKYTITLHRQFSSHFNRAGHLRLSLTFLRNVICVKLSRARLKFQNAAIFFFVLFSSIYYYFVNLFERQ